MERISPWSKLMLSLAFVAVTLWGCGAQQPDSREERAEFPDPSIPDYYMQDGSSLEFVRASSSAWGLSRKVFKPSIKACVSDPQNSEKRRQVVKTSILTWVNALKDVATKSLASSVEFGEWNSGNCDVYFKVTSNLSVAQTAMGSIPAVYVTPTGWYGSDTVILHEFGHAFGLGDTYSGRGGACQAGQPSSVMCYAKFMELKPDDIAGMKSIYNSLYPGSL